MFPLRNIYIYIYIIVFVYIIIFLHRLVSFLALLAIFASNPQSNLVMYVNRIYFCGKL